MVDERIHNRPTIVLPTIRDAIVVGNFFNNWKGEFNGTHVIVIEDREKKTLEKPMELFALEGGFTYDLYDWRDIDKDLGDKAWCISRHSDSIRNYGFYKAWQNEALFIVTLDDDTKPSAPGHIKSFYNKLFQPGECNDNNWYTTLQFEPARGTPTVNNPRVGIAHGGWLNNADLSAKEQIKRNTWYGDTTEHVFNRGVVPKGALFSMCGMNVAFRTELAQHMYFILQGEVKHGKKLEKLPVDRVGDIVAGIRAKRWCDDNGYYVLTGAPFVIHERASNVWNNLKKEEFAQEVINFFADMSAYITSEHPRNEYYHDALMAMREWDSLFERW